MVSPDGESVRLHSFARSLTPQSRIRLHLRSRPGQPARNVELELAFSPVVLNPPEKTEGVPIHAWCVRVWEPDDDGLEWILVSTDPVNCIQDALQKVAWYKHRRLVEV